MKYLIILILMLPITINLHAQKFKKIEYGLYLGASFSVPYQKDIERTTDFGQNFIIKSNSKMGYFSELLFLYNFTSKTAICTGLNFTQYKLNSNFQSDGLERDGTVNESYLNIPFLIQYQLFEKIPISLSAGPYIGILINAKENGVTKSDIPVYDKDGNLVDGNINYDFDVKEAFKSYDFGVSTKLGYEIKISSEVTCIFFCKFNYGLIDVRKDEIIEWKNYYLMTGIGIKI
ncbi:porin family protein [Maribellus maritimus]|uniref:porin family protein n=1 Tax=Maribellus maritimus TaxID=2870838 RepID=UPI001EECCD5C|nr:porin family protein [Maribellus maritimus]MCG6186401.1 PorT family protein [Maribellus maritimus]